MTKLVEVPKVRLYCDSLTESFADGKYYNLGSEKIEKKILLALSLGFV